MKSPIKCTYITVYPVVYIIKHSEDLNKIAYSILYISYFSKKKTNTYSLLKNY